MYPKVYRCYFYFQIGNVISMLSVLSIASMWWCLPFDLNITGLRTVQTLYNMLHTEHFMFQNSLQILLSLPTQGSLIDTLAASRNQSISSVTIATGSSLAEVAPETGERDLGDTLEIQIDTSVHGTVILLWPRNYVPEKFLSHFTKNQKLQLSHN